MRTRRGFALHFLVLTAGACLTLGVTAAGLRTAPAPHVAPELRDGSDSLWLGPAEMTVTVSATSELLDDVRDPQRPEYRGVEYRGVRLTGSLRNRTFTECDFRGADLRGIDLRGCEFWECDLRGARLDGANLAGVRYTSGTQWPVGFDPEAHGARLEE